MERLKIIGKILSKIGKHMAPVIFGYEVNDMITQHCENRVEKYVPIVHKVIENEQNDGLVKNMIIGALIGFFMIFVSVKLYMKYKASGRGDQPMELHAI